MPTVDGAKRLLLLALAMAFGLLVVLVASAGAASTPGGTPSTTTTVLDPGAARLGADKPDPASPPTTIPAKGAPLPAARTDRSIVTDAKGNLRVVDSAGRTLGYAARDASGGGPLGPAPKVPGTFRAADTNPYQADHVFLQDITTQAYNADVNTYIYERGCTDGDSCNVGTGTRKTSGYVWFDALETDVGLSPSNCQHQMHAGLGMGNGVSNQWFFDWSGYYCATGAGHGTGLGHSISLSKERWYRIRIWRLDSFVYGGTTYWGWGAWVQDIATGTESFAGTWYLYDSPFIETADYWTEVVEDGGPCYTDILGVHAYGSVYRDVNGLQEFRSAHNDYESTCSNTNLGRVGAPSGRYTIDDRVATRTVPQGSTLWSY